jgi:DNA-binding SARP family transcriptional activator
MLNLTTLGGLSVRRAGSDEPEPHLQRRRLALLAAVGSSWKRGFSRDRLILLLWPETDGESARNNLKQGVFALRRELGADALVGDGQELRLNPEVWECDRWTFESALAEGALEQAVAAYGGPFLDGFHVGGEAEEFERWTDAERAALAAAHQEALDALAVQADARQDFSASCRWWRRLAAIDPLDSGSTIGLMRALALVGNSVAALQHGRVHQELVRREAGIEPDPMVAALAEQIRIGRLVSPAASKTTPPPQAGGPRPVSQSPGPPTRSSDSTGSVHARQLRDQLEAALADRYLIMHEATAGRNTGPTRSYVARDLRHARTVIVKALHPSLASLIDVERFVREIAFTARLNHPHIVPLLESGEVNGRPWFTIPNVAGETLRERLTRDGRLQTEEALRLAAELAEALDHAHRHGIIHRDVAPENILLAEGHALLSNLGVARALDAAATPQLTETGMLIGTPAYMSPEQASGERPVDGRSDVYSLGCVLYELLAGEPLHSGPTPQAIVAKRRIDPAPKLRSLQGVPDSDVSALLKALEPDPAARFVSAEAFGLALSSRSP